MDTYFELLDEETGTLLKEYASEVEALDDLWEFGQEHGPDQLHGLALLRVRGDLPTLLAKGETLIERVEMARRALR